MKTEMDDKIEWTAPAVVFQIEKEEEKARRKREVWGNPRIWWMLVIGLCLIIAATVFLLHSAQTPESPLPQWNRQAIMLSPLLTLTFPVGIVLTSLFNFKSELRYKLNRKGIFAEGWYPMRSGWKQLESYRFLSHAQVPEVRVLELKLKGSKRRLSFFFDPREVDEIRIRAILRKYGPWDIGRVDKRDYQGLKNRN